MARIKRVFLMGLVVLSVNCAPKEKPLAQFRVGQFLFSTEKATITLYENNREKTSLQLDYGTLSDYRSIPPSSYFIKVWADGKLLLEKKIGLGSKGNYTFLLTGIPEKNQPVNKKSILNTLQSIAQGSEAITPNDFLPQLIVQNDFYVEEKGKGTIRFSQLSPGTVPLSLQLWQNGSQTEIGTQAYPKSSQTKAIGPGTYDLRLQLKGSPQATAMGPLKIKEGFLYSLYLVPDSNHYLTHPKLIIGIKKR